MGIGKMIGIGVSVFVALMIIGFIFQTVGLGFYGYFAPKYEEVRRNTFEETKSYVQGKIQDLAKRFDEWSRADKVNDTDSRTAIEELIKMEFADFDETNIRNNKLREFLIKIRGF